MRFYALRYANGHEFTVAHDGALPAHGAVDVLPVTQVGVVGESVERKAADGGFRVDMDAVVQVAEIPEGEYW